MISTGRLDDDGYCGSFGDNQWKITKGSIIIALAKNSCGLYWLEASVNTDHVNAVESVDSSDLWHRRLSHISVKRLDCLAKKNMLSGLKDPNLDRCVHCLAGKQKRVSFKHYLPSRKNELFRIGTLRCLWPFESKVI